MFVAPVRFLVHQQRTYVKNRGATVEDQLETPGSAQSTLDVTTITNAINQLTNADKVTLLPTILKYMPQALVYNHLVEYLLKCRYLPPVERVQFLNQITEHLSEDNQMSLIQSLLTLQPDTSVAELVLVLIGRVPADYVKKVTVRLKQQCALPTTPSR